jgi:hypothetical protein
MMSQESKDLLFMVQLDAEIKRDTGFTVWDAVIRRIACNIIAPGCKDDRSGC